MTTTELKTTTPEEGLQALEHLLKNLKFGMLTAVHDGVLRARPMTLLQCQADGNLWFLTSKTTSLVPDIENDARVNVSFSGGEQQGFVSVSGRARLTNDRAKLEELWNPAFVTWFPEGLNDPNLSLLRIEAESAESWNTVHGAFTVLFGIIKAIATGEPARVASDHVKLELK